MALGGHPAFQAAEVSTEFIPQHHDQLFPPRSLSVANLTHAALVMAAKQKSSIFQHLQTTRGIVYNKLSNE